MYFGNTLKLITFLQSIYFQGIFKTVCICIQPAFQFSKEYEIDSKKNNNQKTHKKHLNLYGYAITYKFVTADKRYPTTVVEVNLCG